MDIVVGGAESNSESGEQDGDDGEATDGGSSADPVLRQTPALPFWKEARIYLNIAWPIVVSNLCMTGMGLTDISVLGNFYGNDSEGLNITGNMTVATEYLAAASLADIWQSLSSVVIWQGFASALSVLASTAYGAKNYRLVGIWLYLTLLVCSIVCIPVGVSWLWAADILNVISEVTDNLRHLITVFSDFMLFGLMPQQWYACINLFLVAQGIVLPQIILSSAALAANFGFNFLYIYGIPQVGLGGLGFPGSPLATSSSQWFRFLAMLIFLFVSRKKFAKFLCFNRRRRRVEDSGNDSSENRQQSLREPLMDTASGDEEAPVLGESADEEEQPEQPHRPCCAEICRGSRVKEYMKQVRSGRAGLCGRVTCVLDVMR